MRKKTVGLLVLALAALATSAAAETAVKVGWCARTVSSAAAPFAIATKMGWFKDAGISVELVPLPGSTDCVKLVGTGDVAYALPSVEPLASLRPQGLKAKVFYTAYQGNIYGPAVPADSPIKTLADLKGKKIGVQAMASAGYPVMRAIAASEGLDPDVDISIVVVGEGAQAVALAQGYAKGTIFAIANPEAAVRILWEVFPLTKSTGKDEATALKDDMKAIEARIVNWKLDKAGVKRWGENSEANYRDYVDFLVKWSVITQKVPTSDLITNDLIEDINRMDVGKIAAEAAAYRYRR